MRTWQAALVRHVALQCLEGPLQQQGRALAGTKQLRRAMCSRSAWHQPQPHAESS